MPSFEGKHHGLAPGTQDTRFVYGPDFNLEPTIIDSAMGDIYARPVLVFRLQDGFQQDAVVDILLAAYQRLVNTVPWLAAEVNFVPGRFGSAIRRDLADMFHNASWMPMSLRTKSPAPHPVYSVRPGAAILEVQHDPNLRYHDLQPNDFKGPISPQLPQVHNGRTTYPACACKATFTADNCLILVFATYHVVADGFTQMKVVELFAEQVRLETGGATDEKSLIDLSSVPDRRLIRDLTPLGPVMTSTVPHHPAVRAFSVLETVWTVVRLVTTLGFAFLSSAFTSKHVRETYTISMDSLSRLKPKLANGKFVSTHDLASALLWRSVMAASHGNRRIAADEMTAFMMPADMRKSLSQIAPESSTYLGNAVTIISTTIPLRTLLAEDGVVAGALAIRESIKQMSASTCKAHISILMAAADPWLAVPRIFEEVPANNLFMVTSRFAFPPWQWNWGPALGPLQSVHYPQEMIENHPFILPKNKDGTMNVMIRLDARVRDLMARDSMWTSFAKPAIIEH